MALLLREAIGGSLRRARTSRRRTLRDVSRTARVSLGYLSEVERGRKEPSSELLASICEALDLALPELLADAAAEMRDAVARDAALRFRRPIGLGHTDLRVADGAAGPLPTPAGPVPVATPAPAPPARSPVARAAA